MNFSSGMVGFGCNRVPARFARYDVDVALVYWRNKTILISNLSETGFPLSEITASDCFVSRNCAARYLYEIRNLFN